MHTNNRAIAIMAALAYAQPNRGGSGTLATALAAAPIVRPTDAPPVETAPVVETAEPAIVTSPATGETVGAPGHARVQTVGATGKVNPIAELLGPPAFTMADRAVYPNKSNPNMSQTRLVNVLWQPGSILKLTATIYMEETQQPGGAKPIKRLKLTQPLKGWQFVKESRVVMDNENRFKKSITDACAGWLRGLGEGVASAAVAAVDDSTTEIDF